MIDLLYLAHNRLEFTRETFQTLLAHTNWKLVRRLYVYDDQSTDGTRQYLLSAILSGPVRYELHMGDFGSPVAALADFVQRAQAPLVAKVDNDTMVPSGWLEHCSEVMDNCPELDLLGIEPMDQVDGKMASTPYFRALCIGGIGIFRRSAFAEGTLRPDRKYYGFQTWQNQQRERLTFGWLNPPLRVFLLDRIPFAPWCEYSSRYIQIGWQRPWPAYPANDTTRWEWWSPK